MAQPLASPHGNQKIIQLIVQPEQREIGLQSQAQRLGIGGAHVVCGDWSFGGVVKRFDVRPFQPGHVERQLIFRCNQFGLRRQRNCVMQ